MDGFVTRLGALEKELVDFVSPENKFGFFKTFCNWVYDNWSESEYFDTKQQVCGYDIIYYPERTHTFLRNRCYTYKDFINANTGSTYASFFSDRESSCEQYCDWLNEVYQNACQKQLHRLIEKYQLHLPKKYASLCDNLFSLIMLEYIPATDKALFDLSQRLVKLVFSTEYLQIYKVDAIALDEYRNIIYQDNSPFINKNLAYFTYYASKRPSPMKY